MTPDRFSPVLTVASDAFTPLSVSSQVSGAIFPTAVPTRPPPIARSSAVFMSDVLRPGTDPVALRVPGTGPVSPCVPDSAPSPHTVAPVDNGPAVLCAFDTRAADRLAHVARPVTVMTSDVSHSGTAPVALCVPGTGPVSPRTPDPAPGVPSLSDIAGGGPAVLRVSDTHAVAPSAPGARPSAESAFAVSRSDTTSAASVVPGTLRPDTRKASAVVASFDGGCRLLERRSAYAWCVWSESHRLMHWEARSYARAGSNNEMEAQGLLSCLLWLSARAPHATLFVFGDSQLIIGQALMQCACFAPLLRPRIAVIRSLGAARPLIYLQHMRRAYNAASGALCNWIMDVIPPGLDETRWATDWPKAIPSTLALSPAVLLPFHFPVDSYATDLRAHAMAAWSLVLQEYSLVRHLIRRRFVTQTLIGPVHQHTLHTSAPSQINTTARSQTSLFATAARRSCIVDGLRRCVPLDVFLSLREAAEQRGIPFPQDSAFLAAGPRPLQVPVVDARILDALVTDPGLGIAGVLKMFRGQTTVDERPNKALRPWLYQAHLASYSQLSLLRAIAADGIVPPWVHPSARRGVRPVPDNYIGAVAGASIVTDKLLADYYKGRCLVATMTTLQRDPGFHSSSFALVPKRDMPIHLDGRIIHDLSSPPSGSVNDQTNSDASPDATWDPFDSIAQRVRDLRRRFPGYAIYAMIADIADAFHHVPVHADHASAFGGQLPRSQYGLVSGMAVFGWTSSPGYFAVFGKAVRHFQRTGASYILGYSEQFWIFQWVDDIVLVEVDIGDRLQKAEQRLRDGVKLVFGSDGWHEGKFTTWSSQFHAVGIDWNIPGELITVPQRKIDKLRRLLADTASKKFVTMKQLDSLVGVLRHVISFIPITKPFIQRLVAVQSACRKRRKPGIPMTEFLLKDISWWRKLVFQNEFAGVPMKLFERAIQIDDVWLLQPQGDGIVISSMILRERLILPESNELTVARSLAEVTREWGPRLEVKDAWRHVTVHSKHRWDTRIIDKMNCRTTEGQDLLRQCALSQAQHRLHFSTHTFRTTMEQTRECDVHPRTNQSIDAQIVSASVESKARQDNSNELQLQKELSDAIAGISNSGSRFVTTSGSRVD